MTEALNPTDPDYWTQGRPAAPSWPDADPLPEVTNRDPRPVDAPETPRPVLRLMVDGEAASWTVLTGYSRGSKRAQKIGTYTRTETFGVWASVHPSTGWRWSAMYERPIGGKTWTWARTSIWRKGVLVFSDASVTDLKDFIEVRGSVLPGWFEAITARVQAAKAKAKARPTIKKAREATS